MTAPRSHQIPRGVKDAEALAMRHIGVLAFHQSSPLTAHDEAILASYREGEDRVLEEAMVRIESGSQTVRALVGFSGPVGLVLVASIAAGLERDGRKVWLQWIRDLRGVIDGVCICEVL